MRQKTQYAEQPDDISVQTYGISMALVLLRENITQTASGWEADEYMMHTADMPGLIERVRQNRAVWLQAAKQQDYDAAAASARAERNARLAATDYIMRDDYPASTEYKRQIADYCNALRDLPEQPGFPHDIAWPELPPAPTKAARPLTAERVDELQDAIDTMLTGGEAP